MTDESQPRTLRQVGIDPIEWPTTDELAWLDEISSHAVIGIAIGKPELRDGALRILAGFRAPDARKLVLESLDRVARGELASSGVVDDSAAAAWATSAVERLRQHWSTANESVRQMLDQLAEIAEAVRMGGVTGFYMVAHTDYCSTRGWSAGEYDRPLLYFALGHAQHQLLADSRDDDSDG